MKSVFVLFTLILISACVSKPTWDNMSEEVISEWKLHAVGAELANEFTESGITPKAYSEWKAVEITDPETIISWDESKFTAVSAKSWISSGFSLDEAVENRAKGLSPVKKSESAKVVEEIAPVAESAPVAKSAKVVEEIAPVTESAPVAETVEK
jgi:hypothetical protein